MTSMRSSRVLHAVFWVVAKTSEVLGQPGPAHWLTVAGDRRGSHRSVAIDLHEVDGRAYLTDASLAGKVSIDVRPFRMRAGDLPFRSWADDMRARGRAVLTTRRTDADVILTEVTDPAIKRQVLTIGLTDASTGGLAAAMSSVAVFEVTSARSQPARATAARAPAPRP
jgi:hypothetical protein